MNTANNNWQELRKIEEVAGEARANLVRLFALLVLYANYVVQSFVLADSNATDDHQRVILVVLLWFASVVAVYIRIRAGVPGWFKYLISAWDIAMVSWLLVIRDVPQCSLVSLYFVCIAMAALRWSIPLIQASTVMAIVGYLGALSYYVVHEIGLEKYYQHPELRISRYDQAVTVVALILAGVLAGQVVRQIRRAISNLTMASAVETKSRVVNNEDNHDS